jgi:hypothetical protein
MKRTFKTLATIAAITSLTACGSLGKFNSNGDEQIRNQKLSTSFNDGLKIETNCSWFKSEESCEVVAIEATAVVPSNGATNANAHTAKIRAEMQAKAKVAHYLSEKVDSSIVTTTIAKNIEKAKDRLKTDSGGHDDEVTMSENEANQTKRVTPGENVSVRENSNDTSYNLTQSIRSTAATQLRGFRAIKYEAVSPQEVAVTIRWDKKSDVAARKAYTMFNGK